MSIVALTSDTLVASPGAGQIEYNGQFYGTDSNASRAQMQRLVQATSQASTSGTSIDFTGLPAWVKRITVMFSGVSMSGTTAAILIQLGVGSTPTTTGYLAGQGYINLSGTGTLGSNSTEGIPIQFGAASYTMYGTVVFTNVSSNIWVAAGTLYNPTTVPYTDTVAGGITLSGVLGMVRIKGSNGTDTFDAGSINILYEG